MAGSVVVAVRKAVAEGLASLIALTDATVSYAWDPSLEERYQIFTGRSTAQTPPAALKSGRNFRSEEATFQLVIQVVEVGGNGLDGDEKAMEFGQVVEEWLADRKGNELGVTGLNWIRAESWELNGGPNDRAYISQLIFTIRYQARLT